MNKIFLILLFLLSIPLYSQDNSVDWSKFNFLAGEWVGTGEGDPGKGEGKFSFAYDLDNNIFVRKNRNIIPASQTSIEKIHDDLMIIYPAEGPGFKAIYFDNEGHTIDYSVKFEEKSVVFISEKKTNMPFFRLTYTLSDENTVKISFDFSQDGTNYRTYLEGNAVKIR